MKKMNSKKGFTLIELLIVIAIIAVLAVAMLPTLLNAPSKGRDTARLANLNSIQKALIYDNLTNSVSFPTSTGCAGTVITSTGAIANMGGKVPVDASSPARTKNGSTDLSAGTTSPAGCAASGSYFYASNPNDGTTVKSGTYSYGLYALMENSSKDTVKCSDAIKGTKTSYTTVDGDLCYAILAQ